MDVIPAELHSYICEFACTDDGRTARSLSLVSKYFFQVTHPFLYQSIAVTGYHQIGSLESRLQNTRLHLRHVRNLYIDVINTDPLVDKSTAIQHGSSHVKGLLAIISNTIQTLTFSCGDPQSSTSLIGVLFSLNYPHLRELSVVGYYPFPHLSNCMPRVTHLYLDGNRNPHGLLQLGTLEDACPQLTHLRVSGLSGAGSFAGEVADALRADERCLFKSRFPPQLKCLVLQPGPQVQHATKMGLRDKNMMENLEKLESFARHNSGIRLMVLKSEGNVSRISRQHWLERLNGHEGCWPSK